MDVVKFQKRNPDICVPKLQKQEIKETPWGKMAYIKYKHKVEFGKKEFDIIHEYCKKLNINWTASVWDTDSLNFILQYNVPFIKIPSAYITDLQLLKQVNLANKPVIISTGMSTKSEIEKAILLLDQIPQLSILHCNSSYPTQSNEIDLNAMISLKNKYKTCAIGYSGHEIGALATLIAKTLVADIIERHITLNKDMWGSDHSSSLDPMN